MITFILNNSLVTTGLSPGITLLDFIRYEENLTGTKIGCREGDCGACTILAGELLNGKLEYRSATSCLMPLANAHGKHIVTIEGINFDKLNPVQQAMSDEGATQCGFCTPGFVVSLAGYCLQDKYSDVVSSIDGNICRCTGYKSIERAANKIADLILQRKNDDVIGFAIANKLVPEYFADIKKQLLELSLKHNGIAGDESTLNTVFVGGGTDLYVQKHEEMTESNSKYLTASSAKSIYQKDGKIFLGASVSVTDLKESPIIRELFPDFLKYSKLVSSTPIRNMATIAGNFVNASPIGDFTVFFLAIDAVLILKNKNGKREIELREFYKGYKKLNKNVDEYIDEIYFNIPAKDIRFNFEKVSKRTNLDIASVNSAISISLNGDYITKADITAGGVGPIPMYLKKTSEFFSGKKLSEELIDEACIIAGNEIAPISDARGEATYKRFLLQQLIRAHFITLFPKIRPDKFQSAYEEY